VNGQRPTTFVAFYDLWLCKPVNNFVFKFKVQRFLYWFTELLSSFYSQRGSNHHYTRRSIPARRFPRHRSSHTIAILLLARHGSRNRVIWTRVCQRCQLAKVHKRHQPSQDGATLRSHLTWLDCAATCAPSSGYNSTK